MKTSICHYSLHRTFKAKNWSLKQLVDYVKGQGVDAIDFHVAFLPPPATAAAEIRMALEGSGLQLSGVSLSTNFNQDEPAKFQEQVDTAKRWLEVAAAVKAPVSRVFGGHIKNRSDGAALKTGMDRVLKGLGELVPFAQKAGVILALENHGGLPCSGEEQASVISQIDSPFLRATVDVGNYMQFPQDPVKGSQAAAKYCAYVHFKDNRRLPDGKLKSAVLGEGDVNLAGCLQVLKDAGYDGFVALEYEGELDELQGVPKSVAHMKKVIVGL